MTFCDTSILISCFTGTRELGPLLRSTIASGEPVRISSLVLYEWLRGPRRPEELLIQEGLLPSALAVPYGRAEAVLTAGIYRIVARPRGREVDLGIAACAILRNAQLWTLNTKDFSDIPGLRLAQIR